MESKIHAKEIHKRVGDLKRQALKKRRVRIPDGYMSWDDFVSLGCNAIVTLDLNGGKECTDASIVSAGLMYANALLSSNSELKFKCYCVDPELRDSLEHILVEFEPHENRVPIFESIPLGNSIVFFPVRHRKSGKSDFLTFVVMFDSETGTFNFMISIDSGDEVALQSAHFTWDEANTLNMRGGDLIGIMCLNALSTLNDAPEYQEIDSEPRKLGFGQTVSAKTSTYEYPTILKQRILPINPTRVNHGGTHASPRPHDRRGHWRRKPKGETSDLIWVKPSKIGVKKDE